MVWMTDAGHTMLVPTFGPKSREVYEHQRDSYEILTRDLLANWNKIEKTISEDGNIQNLQQGGNQENLQEPEGTPGDEEQGKANKFKSEIDVSTVDRTPILRAMQDRGHTVTSLANEVGVDPPAISRILRTPKDVQGDPGGRNPSMGLASQICNVLRIDPTAAFPDIFAAKNYEARQTPGNAGSGDHAHGKGGGKWNQGSGISESLEDTLEILEATEIYDVLCEEIASSGLPFDCFWKKAFWPSVRRIRPNTTVVDFAETLRHIWNEQSLNEDTINEFWGKRPQPKADQAGFDNWVNGLPQEKPAAAAPKKPNLQPSIDRMNSQIMPPIQKAFQHAMDTLKKDLQQVQYKAGANPKVAPHAWEVINRFYKTVMNAGKNYAPKWKQADPSAAPGYASDYDKAKSEFSKMNQPSNAPTEEFDASPIPSMPERDDDETVYDLGNPPDRSNGGRSTTQNNEDPLAVPSNGGAQSPSWDPRQDPKRKMGQLNQFQGSGGAMVPYRGGGTMANSGGGAGGGPLAQRGPSSMNQSDDEYEEDPDIIDAEYEVKQPTPQLGSGGQRSFR